MKPLRIFTWHIHGNYLYYLSQTNCEFYIPFTPKWDKPGYYGKTKNFPWGKNVYEVPVQGLKNLDFDCILFQSQKNYLEDQYEILTPKQQLLPKVYLEHDPPRLHPTDTKHIINDESILLIHVTNFNKLMWDSGKTPTVVIQHGVLIPPTTKYIGSKNRGIVVINNLSLRGRRLGLDIFQEVRKHIPLDLIGMNSKEIGGLGEIPNQELPNFIAQYRFLFNPIRYTSLGLAVCEAMMIGLPIIGLATTEMTTTIQNGKSGFIATDINTLIEKMQLLLDHPDQAHTLSKIAKTTAEKHFSLERFTKEWEKVFLQVCQRGKTIEIESVEKQEEIMFKEFKILN